MTLEGAFFSNTDSGSGYVRDSFMITKDPDIGPDAPRKVDFNGDGYADLAVGVPGEDFGSKTDTGAVNLIYGSSAGLSNAGNQLWQQDSASIEDFAEAGDQFGWALE